MSLSFVLLVWRGPPDPPVQGALGLNGPKGLRKIGVLSGGEKARVALAIFVMIPYNVLMLDEPSNHLGKGGWGAACRAHGCLVCGRCGWRPLHVRDASRRALTDPLGML